MTNDPLAPLLELSGVAMACEQARDALGRAHRHPANLRDWPVTAAEAALRAARASAVLDGGVLRLDVAAAGDPIFAGALRVAQALEGGQTSLVGVWQRAPMQALARLHMLAAAGQVDADQLGRPRVDADVAPRLELLADLVSGGTRAPAPVVAAVAHGELLTLGPFGSADGVVARAVSRLVTVATGLDPMGWVCPRCIGCAAAPTIATPPTASRPARRKASGPGCCCAAARCRPVRARRCRSPTPWRVVSRADRE